MASPRTSRRSITHDDSEPPEEYGNILLRWDYWGAKYTGHLTNKHPTNHPTLQWFLQTAPSPNNYQGGVMRWLITALNGLHCRGPWPFSHGNYEPNEKVWQSQWWMGFVYRSLFICAGCWQGPIAVTETGRHSDRHTTPDWKFTVFGTLNETNNRLGWNIL